MSKKTLFLTEPHYNQQFDAFDAELHLSMNGETFPIGSLIIGTHGVIVNVSAYRAVLVIENMPVLNVLHLASLVTTALSDAFMNLNQETITGYIDCFRNGDVLVLEVTN